MTNDQLTAALAERLMGWRVGPDRYQTGNRGWLPRWRFRPTERLEDAQRLLERAAPEEYTVEGVKDGRFRVKIRIDGAAGEACEPSQAKAISVAVARAIGLEPEGCKPPKTGVECR